MAMIDEMKTLKNQEKYPLGFLAEIFGRIWALWALVLFVTTMIIFLIPFLLFCYFQPDPLKTKRFISYSRVWMGIFLYGVGCPLKIRGKEWFEEGETFIVICNHNSLIDVPVSSPGIPGGNKTIAKIEMARIPVFNLLYKTGSVLVDRKSDASRRESFTKMKEVLDMGLHMCIYPEGTRNKTNQPLKHFHDGAFRLALMTGKRIIPAVIFNSKHALPASKPFFLWPQPLAMHFLPPIPISDEDDIDSLKDKAYGRMREYFEAYA
jgi:1-acyl-sn-glycerol-3-phosphate acyltransferase